MVTSTTIISATITFFLLTIPLLVFFIFPSLFIKWSKKDKFFTTLEPETGKIVGKGENAISYLFNSKVGHYNDNGVWVDKKRGLGYFFEKFGVIYFGFYYRKILTFKVYKQDKTFVEQKTFKQFYNIEFDMKEIEIANGKNKIDAKGRLKFRVVNIERAIYHTEPNGINLSQALPDIETCFSNYVRQMGWEAYEKEDKTSKGSDFILKISKAISEITEGSMGIVVVEFELGPNGLSKNEENEKLAKSLILDDIEKNEAKALKTKTDSVGENKVAAAEYEKRAHLLKIEGEIHHFNEVGKVAKENPEIIPFMNLGQLKGTEVRVFGNNTVMPTIDVDGAKK